MQTVVFLALLISLCFADEQEALQQDFPTVLTGNNWTPSFKPSYGCANYSFNMDSFGFFTIDRKSLGMRLGSQVVGNGNAEDLILPPKNCTLSFSAQYGQLACTTYVRIAGSCGLFISARVDDLKSLGNGWQIEVDADFRFLSCPRCKPQDFEVTAQSQGGSSTGSYYTTGSTSGSYYPPPAYTSSSSSTGSYYPPPAYTSSSSSTGSYYNPPSYTSSSTGSYYPPPAYTSSSSSTGSYYNPPSYTSSSTGSYYPPPAYTSSSSGSYYPPSYSSTGSSSSTGSPPSYSSTGSYYSSSSTGSPPSWSTGSYYPPAYTGAPGAFPPSWVNKKEVQKVVLKNED